MKAWMKRGDALELSDVDAPVPAGDELLLRVEAISLNRGEIRGAARAPEGFIPGWDVAGTVLEPAASGRGPAKGARVAALLTGGGWAEVARVPAAHAAVVPDDVELAAAATLPIAGLTVVRAFDVAGSLVGKQILITGGSGGVGHLAIQLGAIGGAHVTAVSSRAGGLRELGAQRTVAAIEEAGGTYDLILESVGGASLAAALERVARGGVVVSIGNSAEEETTFNARTLFGKGGASLYGLLVFEELESRRVTARDLERLFSLVAAGRLRPAIEVRRPFPELRATLDDLKRRAFSGKAVVTVG